MSTPEQVPSSLIVGDTWQWTRDLSDYPASTWTLNYYLTKSGKVITVTASASGTTHSVTVAAATTATYEPGKYQWRARASSGGVVVTVEDGWVEVDPNPATSTTDPRSWAVRTLEAIEAFLEGNATTAQASMSIAGRSLSRWALPDLTAFRDKLRAEVRSESGSTSGAGRNIKVRYASP